MNPSLDSLSHVYFFYFIFFSLGIMDAEKKALAADGESGIEIEKMSRSLKNILWVYSVHFLSIPAYTSHRRNCFNGTGYTTCYTVYSMFFNLCDRSTV